MPQVLLEVQVGLLVEHPVGLVGLVDLVVHLEVLVLLVRLVAQEVLGEHPVVQEGLEVHQVVQVELVGLLVFL